MVDLDFVLKRYRGACPLARTRLYARDWRMLRAALGGVVDGLGAWLLLRLLSGVASAFCLVLGTATVVEALVDRGIVRMAPSWDESTC